MQRNHSVIGIASGDEGRRIVGRDNVVQRRVLIEKTEMLWILLGIPVLGGPMEACW